MAHRQIIPLYMQKPSQVMQDLTDCYSPSQLFGLAIHFNVYAKRYWDKGSFDKAKFYHNLHNRILNLKDVVSYRNRNRIQLEIDFVFPENN